MTSCVCGHNATTYCLPEKPSESPSSLGWWHCQSSCWSSLQVQPKTLERKNTEWCPGEWRPCDLGLINGALINGANQLRPAEGALYSGHCLFSWNDVLCTIMLKLNAKFRGRAVVCEKATENTDYEIVNFVLTPFWGAQGGNGLYPGWEPLLLVTAHAPHRGGRTGSALGTAGAVRRQPYGKRRGIPLHKVPCSKLQTGEIL